MSVSGVVVFCSLLPSLIWYFSFAVICPSASSSNHPDNGSMIFYANDTGLQQFEKWWNKSKTVPFYLIGLLLPLLNFKSPSFFSKFNILGKLRHYVIEPLCSRICAGFFRNMVWLEKQLPCKPVYLCLICSFICYPAFGFSSWSLAQRKNTDHHFKSFSKMSYWDSHSSLTEQLVPNSSKSTTRGSRPGFQKEKSKVVF